MKEQKLCAKGLCISEDISLDLEKNVPTRDLKILSHMSIDFKGSILRYKGKLLTADEYCDGCLLIICSSFIGVVKIINSKYVLIDIRDIATFLKKILENT